MTIEEIQEQMIQMQEQMETIKNENEQLKNTIEEKTQRENELLQANQKLFLRVTTKQENKEEEKNVPFCIDESTFNLLSKREIEQLEDILEEE